MGCLVLEIGGVEADLIKVTRVGARVTPGGKDPGSRRKLVLKFAVVVEVAMGSDGRAQEGVQLVGTSEPPVGAVHC